MPKSGGCEQNFTEGEKKKRYFGGKPAMVEGLETSLNSFGTQKRPNFKSGARSSQQGLGNWFRVPESKKIAGPIRRVAG